MRRAAMFPHINSLPGPQYHRALHNWNGEVDGRQRGADMSWHVIFAFGSVHKQRVSILYQASKEALQVTTHVRISVLLD